VHSKPCYNAEIHLSETIDLMREEAVLSSVSATHRSCDAKHRCPRQCA
jgi:hypothetical protein